MDEASEPISWPEKCFYKPVLAGLSNLFCTMMNNQGCSMFRFADVTLNKPPNHEPNVQLNC